MAKEQQKDETGKDWGKSESDKQGIVQTENLGNQATPGKTKGQDENDIHPVVVDNDILRNSGKEQGLVHAPVVSIAPSSGKPAKRSDIEPKILSDVSILIGEDKDDEYPYDKLKLEQGFFVPTQPNSTTDALLAKIHRSINTAKKRYGEIEVNEEGDEILDMVCVQTKKRNDDGTIQLHGDGKPNVGADFQQIPRYIYTRNYVAKPVIKGQKIGEGVDADSDGVVVIRVA